MPCWREVRSPRQMSCCTTVGVMPTVEYGDVPLRVFRGVSDARETCPAWRLDDMRSTVGDDRFP